MTLDFNSYPNLLDRIQLSSKDIVEQVEQLELTFDSKRDEHVEKKMQLPTFLDYFYEMILKEQRIPKQLEFWEYYKAHSTVESMDPTGTLMEGIRARVLRTYPSLIRDIHFAILLKERAKQSEIIYNQDLDVKHGIDVVVFFKHQYFGVNLYVDTKASQQYKKKKKFRHVVIDNITVVNLPIEFSKDHLCGDVYLYGEEELHRARQAIIENTK